MAEACGALSLSGGRSDWALLASCRSSGIDATHLIKDNPDHQAAAGTARNVLAVAHVGYGDFEAVAARAGVVVDLQGRIVEAVLDFYLVVEVQLFVGHGVLWPCAGRKERKSVLHVAAGAFCRSTPAR
jgi:hypothetical protein